MAYRKTATGDSHSRHNPGSIAAFILAVTAFSGRAIGLLARRLASQISSGTILIAPQGHSATQMPQPLQ